MFNVKPTPKNDNAPQEKMPVGTHEATAVYVKTDMTKTGKVRFAVKFQNDAEQVAWLNIIAPDGSNPKHTRMFYSTMAKLSLGQKFLDESDSANEVAEAIVGAKVLATVADEEWQGNTYRKVTWIDELVFAK